MQTLRGPSEATRPTARPGLLPLLALIALAVSACSDVIVTEEPDATRYGTAARLGVEAFPDGADVALLANGSTFADALAAAPLASVLDAPILLTQRDQLPESTEDALDELAVEEVILLGGAAVISDDLQETLLDQYGVTRHAGGDRYQTAAILSGEAFPSGSRVALLATGASFADALAAAPLAASLDAPILLTDRDGIPGATLTALSQLGVESVVLLGGPGAISQGVQDALAGGPFEVSRYAGTNRFETAAMLAREAFPDGAEIAVVATGEGFADALAAAPLADSNGGPILLTAHDELPAATLAALGDLGVTEVVLLGGTAAVADGVEQRLSDDYDITRYAGEA